MKFAYADPPYLGYGSFYDEHHPNARDWNNPDAHRNLIAQLCDEYADGWAMSLASVNLWDILPMCPKKTRVGAWVKPFASFKKNVNPGYAWEPILFSGGRRYTLKDETVRDWIAEPITLKRGLVGAKPRKVCRWIIRMLNAQRGDAFDDLFPGTGAFGAAWADWCGEKTPLPELPLMASQ